MVTFVSVIKQEAKLKKEKDVSALTSQHSYPSSQRARRSSQKHRSAADRYSKMTMNQEPCLSFKPDDNDEQTACVEFNDDDDPIDWDELRQNQSVQELTVIALGQEEVDDQNHHHSLQLAFYINLYPELSQINFYHCTIDDIGPICVAMAAKQHLTKLEFYNCSLALRSAQALQLMLEANKIAVLLFESCECSIEFNETIAMGLRDNQSLQVLQFRDHEPIISSPLITTMCNSPNLVEICLTMNDSTGWWNLLRVVEKKNKLQSLRVVSSTLDRRAMEALMMMCLSISSLRKLDLCYCEFVETSLEYLARTLSRSNAIDTLIFGTLTGDHPLRNGPLEVNFENLQVEKLVLFCRSFDHETFLHVLESLAKNPFIKCLELSSGGCIREKLQVVCDVLLRQNVGPSELVIWGSRHCDDFNLMISEVMQANTNLKSLSIGIMDKANLVTFAENVAHMRGLRKLTFTHFSEHSQDFFRALQNSLERNTTLWTLSFENTFMQDWKDEFSDAAGYLERIRYLLAINRVGRTSLMTVSDAPVDIWARVLERSSNEPDGIYLVLTEKPDILERSAKRKRLRED